MRFPMINKYPEKIDIEKRCREKGYRNFISFISLNYYVYKFSTKKCGELLDLSDYKIKEEMKARSFERRQPGPLPGTKLRKGARKDLDEVVMRKIGVKTARLGLKVLYCEYYLSACEISKLLNVSQSLILKRLREYGIQLRTRGKIKIKEHYGK